MTGRGTVDFVTIVNSAAVERPVSEVCKIVCSFLEKNIFLDVSCIRIAGDGGIGSVRQIGDAILEPMVGASAFSYTYAQTQGPMSRHHYHGCVVCEALGDSHTDIIYTLVYDQSKIEPERHWSERSRMADRFATVVEAMRSAAAG